MSGWTEVLVHVPLGWGELVAEVLAAGTEGSVQVGPAEDLPPAPAGREWVRSALARARDSEDRRAALRASLARLARAADVPELEGLAPEFRELPDEDWADAWRSSWRPFRVGRLCVVTPDWTGEPRPGERRLALVPGGTFGTGRHATTRCCLRLVQERVAAGDRVLDVGTGTGILAVAAALFGAGYALGFDVDPASRPAATGLARENGVGGRCEFRHGGFDVLGEADREFDALVANLYSDLIREHARELRRRLREGGWFAVSGCPTHHLEETRAALEAAGLPVASVHRRGKWLTLAGEAAPRA